MVTALLRKVFGSGEDRVFKQFRTELAEVNRLEPRFVSMTNLELRAVTVGLRERLRAGESLDEILPEAFAVVREASKRVVGLRHYDVQIIGGIVLHKNSIAEMHTGEGKTLVATLPLYLNALVGKGAHLVTVNDYLARRDREWMGPILEFLGLTVGLIQHDMDTYERQVAYRADVTYGTNSEFGFDYLRDNMAVRPEHRAQRVLNYAIIDEVDSILIDEARTPLIISGRPEKSTEHYLKIGAFAKSLPPEAPLMVSDLERPAEVVKEFFKPTSGVVQHLRSHFSSETIALLEEEAGNPEPSQEVLEAIVRELNREKLFSDEFFSSVKLDKDLTRIFVTKPRGQKRIALIRQFVNQYFKLETVFKKDDHGLINWKPYYELEEKGKTVLVSEKALDRLGVELNIVDLYGEDSLGLIHMLEQALKAEHHFKKDVDYMLNNGQVLIIDEFTGRVLEGRRYSDGLHQALEAKEGCPIQFESQTIASITYQNFFRLYAKLAGMTGTAVSDAVEFGQIYKLNVVPVPTNLPMQREDRTDLVFATEEGKFNWLTNDIIEFNKGGRPVLVGTVSVEKSEYVANLLREKGMKDVLVLNAKYHEREAAIISNAGKRGAILIATNMAGRGTDIKLAEGVRELGGLSVIGTERHESRRIDNQLRGRCGRQGDPGTTQFYVSLQDEVARLFGGDRLKKLLDFFGSSAMDDQPLDQRSVSRSIERSQRQVEEYHYESRKHVLKYDDVMNKQRQIIYEIRREVLEDRDVSQRLLDMFDNIVARLVEEFAPDSVLPDEWDLEGLGTGFRRTFGFAPSLAFEGTDEEPTQPKPLIDDLLEQAQKEYERREECIANEIRDAYREQIGGDESAIDFRKLARRRIHDYEKMAILRAVDERWIDHLHCMDYLRESVGVRSIGHKQDPLLEYKQEGFEMFENLLNEIEDEVASTLFRLTDPEVRRRREVGIQSGTLTEKEDPFASLRHYTYIAADKQADRSFASFDTSRFALAGQSDEAMQAEHRGRAATDQRDRPKLQPIRTGPKVGPNDPCPCGSGKKHKKCCGGLEN